MIQQKRSNKQINFRRATVLSVLSLFLVFLFNSSVASNFIDKGERDAYAGYLLIAIAVTTFVFSVRALQKKPSIIAILFVCILIVALTFTQGLFALAANGMR